MSHGRILIVEDDPDIVKIVKTYLEHDGYSLDVALDGLTGLQRALDGVPDLISSCLTGTCQVSTDSN